MKKIEKKLITKQVDRKSVKETTFVLEQSKWNLGETKN